MDETEQASSYGVNSTSINVSRVSSKYELPLASRIVIKPIKYNNFMAYWYEYCTHQKFV